MITVEWQKPFLLVAAKEGHSLSPSQESQLSFWGFTRDGATGAFSSSPADPAPLAAKVVPFLRKSAAVSLCSATAGMLEKVESAAAELRQALQAADEVKNAKLSAEFVKQVETFQRERLARHLKPHQVKSLLHLIAARNSANFSVPGSGKTSVVLAGYAWMKDRNECDALFVVGPPSCFAPWQTEYEAVMGAAPRSVVLAGGNRSVRQAAYCATKENAADLYLTTFQTLQRDWELVQTLFQTQGIRFFLVIDEAHYIKQPDGVWAAAIKEIAPYAAARCVLTGTPFPKSYQDGFNLFDILWPRALPISTKSRFQIINAESRRDLAAAASELKACIGPLFYRVRKHDLGLTVPVLHDPILVPMRPVERRIYDAIIDRIEFLNETEYFENVDTLMRLRKGRITRLRQATSFVPLLRTALESYNEELLATRKDIAADIADYGAREIPAKADALLTLARPILDRGQKVLVWSNFVGTLKFLHKLIARAGYGVKMIYGATPTQSDNVEEALTREGIIREFKRQDSGINVLIANPAACAESISLHTACSHAIYYDLSYNCAQYLQSLDRIHRVGGSETKEAHYYFLQSQDSIDQDIAANLAAKQAKMSALIDEEYPILSLDMSETDDEEEMNAYRRLFGV